MRHLGPNVAAGLRDLRKGANRTPLDRVAPNPCGGAEAAGPSASAGRVSAPTLVAVCLRAVLRAGGLTKGLDSDDNFG